MKYFSFNKGYVIISFWLFLLGEIYFTEIENFENFKCKCNGPPALNLHSFFSGYFIIFLVVIALIFAMQVIV